MFVCFDCWFLVFRGLANFIIIIIIIQQMMTNHRNVNHHHHHYYYYFYCQLISSSWIFQHWTTTTIMIMMIIIKSYTSMMKFNNSNVSDYTSFVYGKFFKLFFVSNIMMKLHSITFFFIFVCVRLWMLTNNKSSLNREWNRLLK